MTICRIASLLDLPRAQKRLIQVGADTALIGLCLFLAMLMRLEDAGFMTDPTVWLVLLATLPVTIFVFWQLGLYRSVTRFITGQAFEAIGIGVLASAAAMFVFAQMMDAPIPHAVPGIHALLLLGAVAGLRFAMRALLRRPAASRRKRVLVYGAGEAGRQLQAALAIGSDYHVVAFIDDDPALQDAVIGGRKVHAASRIGKVIAAVGPQAILLALPGLSTARRRAIIARLEPLGLEIQTVPAMSDIVAGRAAPGELRRVSPEDLLGRDPIPPDPALMGQDITGRVVLVSGAGGSIGSEICRQVIRHDPTALILFDVSEFALYTIATELREGLARARKTVRLTPVLGSVQDAGRVRSVLQAFGVQTIYHAAAYKHVAVVEENVIEGIRNNVFGTRVIAAAATELGVDSFILVSTDKAVRPGNFMGASKRMAELVCQAFARAPGCTTFSMVRFGNVLGSSGSVIPRFQAQIEQGGPVTVTHPEITRFFMTIPEAAQLVIQAGAMARGGDVFILDMGKPVKILDLAQSMIRMHGLRPRVLQQGEECRTEGGDIGIRIVGLNKGDKLYEELLIGNDPQPTDHPRIMKATEHALPRAQLDALLNRLHHACLAADMPAIRRIFLEAPLDYRPADAELHDLTWNAAAAQPRYWRPALKVVSAE